MQFFETCKMQVEGSSEESPETNQVEVWVSVRRIWACLFSSNFFLDSEDTVHREGVMILAFAKCKEFHEKLGSLSH